MSGTTYTAASSKIHFKVYGSGPPIALFHPSPNSSQLMHGLAEELAARFTVICPDTPGYGASPKLAKLNPDMKDYAEAFRSLFEELGFESIALYGSATGAQIAIRYGIEYPDHVSHLFLDNTAHFTEEERQQVLENYFPDLTPRADGKHLVMLWDMVSSLFQYFPWCFKDEEHKLNGPIPPPDVLQTIVLDYLKAGKDYDLAYKAAFNHEKIDFIQLLKVPTSVLRWEGSIIKKYNDRIFDYDLPENVIGQNISGDRSLRYREIANHITEVYRSKHDFKKETLTQNLNIQNLGDTIIDFSEDAPTPDADGLYLIRAWHALKDEVQYSNSGPNATDSIDPNIIQKRLISWYESQNQG